MCHFVFELVKCSSSTTLVSTTANERVKWLCIRLNHLLSSPPIQKKLTNQSEGSRPKQVGLFFWAGTVSIHKNSFRFRPALKTFKRTMDAISSSYQWKHAILYLDSVVIFLKTPAIHTDHVRSILTLPRNVLIKLKLERCEHFTSSFHYLRYIIRAKRSENASHLSDAIRQLISTTILKELKSFLGICSTSAWFVSSFVHVEAPFSKKLQEYQAKRLVQQTQEGTASMNSLQEKLIPPPIPALLHHDGRHSLATKACNAGQLFTETRRQKARTDWILI